LKNILSDNGYYFVALHNKNSNNTYLHKPKTMKKIFTIALIGVALILSNQAEAQLLKWGLKGGVNFSSISGFGDNPVIEATSSYTGWHVGPFLQVKLPIIAVQLDVLYTQQGQEFTISSIKQNLEQSYILIPLVAKVSLIPLLNLQAGVQYGILTTAAVDGIDEFDFGDGNTVAVKDLFKSGDWSIVLGLGFDISKIMIDARYNIGVSDLNAAALTSAELKNGVFQLSAGIKF